MASFGAGDGQKGRQIVVAIDFTDQSLMASRWTVENLYKFGDVIHLVHVSKVLTPNISIQHSAVGSSYDVPDPKRIDTERHIASVKKFIVDHVTSAMDKLGIPHNLHFFLETDNAPASAIGDIIIKVAKDVNAAVAVVGAHNKTGWEKFMLGSVADYCVSHLKMPFVVVRPQQPTDT